MSLISFDLMLDRMVDSLQANKVLAILDWKMKLLMMLYRESMVDYLGKRGIPWMGIMFVRKRNE
jgi:hypothetical protein